MGVVPGLAAIYAQPRELSDLGQIGQIRRCAGQVDGWSALPREADPCCLTTGPGGSAVSRHGKRCYCVLQSAWTLRVLGYFAVFLDG
ncbi:MAG: hypothetical protein KatS3mg077_2015 [Candidatus Binatia bacterium]|nr:MAG: hypothetical protein KatS3mg077_2015 [Candidatus Binatia bacterium]